MVKMVRQYNSNDKTSHLTIILRIKKGLQTHVMAKHRQQTYEMAKHWQKDSKIAWQRWLNINNSDDKTSHLKMKLRMKVGSQTYVMKKNRQKDSKLAGPRCRNIHMRMIKHNT